MRLSERATYDDQHNLEIAFPYPCEPEKIFAGRDILESQFDYVWNIGAEPAEESIKKIYMIDSKTWCEITNKTFGLNVPVELYEMRDNFCPIKGSVTCHSACPIYRNYYTRGLSCNGALDKHPNECIALMQEYNGQCHE